MPVAIQPKTLANIVEAIRVRAKIDSSDTDTLDTIRGFINQRYLSVATEYKWRWLKKRRDLRVPAVYSTGTVAVTINSREVTGTGTAWTAAMAGRFIKIQGEDHLYEIVARNSTTQIELSERIARTTAASLTYEIFQPEFGLWPDLENIDEVWHDYGGSRNVVKPVSNAEYWDVASRSPEETGKARVYAREGFKNYEGAIIGQFVVGYDFAGTPPAYRVLLFPRFPDAAYNVHVTYIQKATPMAADSDEPLMPLEDRWVLVYGGLADYMGQQGNETSLAYWTTEFEKGIKRMLRDQDDTDSKAKLVVEDRWRGKKKPSAARYDLGSYFDKYY